MGGLRTIIRMLHEASRAGLPEVSKQRLLSEIEVETSEVRDMFRKSPLWNTLVGQGNRRGTYQLSLGKDIADVTLSGDPR